MGGHLEIYVANKLYDINIYCLYDILDIHFNTLYYKFCYKFCEDQNLEKDLCIISNKANCHYRLLFSKKHKVTIINKILLFNHNILYNNKSNLEIINNNYINI